MRRDSAERVRDLHWETEWDFPGPPPRPSQGQARPPHAFGPKLGRHDGRQQPACRLVHWRAVVERTSSIDLRCSPAGLPPLDVRL